MLGPRCDGGSRHLQESHVTRNGLVSCESSSPEKARAPDVVILVRILFNHPVSVNLRKKEGKGGGHALISMFLSLPDMDEDNDEINSFQLEEAFNSKCFYLNKKRKTRAEQLGLPISKHKCLDHRFPLKTSKIYEEKDLITCIITGNAERQAIDEGSDPESAKDSNSFVEDSDFAMSIDGEAKFEMEVSKIWPPDRPSTSSFSCNSLKDAQYSSDSAAAARHAGKEELTFVKGEIDQCCHDDGLQASQNLEEPILEFESPLDYSCSEFGTDSIETCTGEELDDILYSNGVNPNVYALSSGRWLSTKKLSQAPENQPLIKNLSSTFPCLCCDSEHLYLELEANDF